MNAALPVIFQAALRARGLLFEIISQFDQDSKVVSGMRTFVFENGLGQIRMRLSFGDKTSAFAVILEEVTTGKTQDFAFNAPSGQNLEVSVEKALDSSPALLSILRGEKSPSNQFDWGEYK